MAKGWGFDPKNIDAKVRPQDDFYHYANGGWLKSHTIPPAESKWGSFYELQHKTDTQIRRLLNELAGLKRAKKGSPEQMVRDTYLAATDMKERARLGTKPLEPYLKLVEGITSREDLFPVITKLHREGTGGLWWMSIDQNSKNAERYIIHLIQGGLGLPDRDYYLKSGKEQLRVRYAYEKHIERLLTLSGVPAKDARAAVPVVMHIETELARLCMPKEDLRDPHKTYHKYTLGKLLKLTPRLDWRAYFDHMGARPRELIVMQPRFLAGVEKLLTRIPVEDWKTYLEWHIVNDFAGSLTPALEKAQFAFYGTTLAGTKRLRPRWRLALGTVNGIIGQQMGKLYVKRYFSAQAKRKVNALVAEITDAYEARIRALDWMSEATKRRAVGKLRAMKRKVGYPGKWLTYRGLTVRPDDHFGNLQRAHEHELRRMIAKLGKPVDREEWFTYPHQVNAYYSPNLNDILFLAGILQHPFFDLSADDALNYAGIGSVIGHELTHGFDDEGSQYDAKGNLRNWWTKKDRKLFEKKAEVLRKQYDQYVVEGLHVNGKLTLGENIADLGGIVIAYDAYRKRLEKTERKDIDGFTPEQRFFLCVAQMECALSRPEVMKLRILTDPHAPAVCRVNGPLSNVPEFYDAFNVKKGDKLYRSPASRARIW